VQVNRYLTLYLPPSSSRWQYVIQIPGHPRVRKTTGERSLDAAKRVAEAALLTVQGRLHQNLPVSSPTLLQVLPKYLEDLQARKTRGEISGDTAENYALVVQRDFVGWAADRAIDQFTDADMVRFRDWRQNRKLRKTLRPASMNIMLTAVNDLFRFAVRSGWVTPRAKPKQAYLPLDRHKTERSDFTWREYVRLRRMSRERVFEVCPAPNADMARYLEHRQKARGEGQSGPRNKGNSRHYRERRILDFVIKIMACTGMRTAEVMNVRWVDLDFIREAHSRVQGLRVRTAELFIKGNDVKPGRTIMLKPYVAHWFRQLHALATPKTDQDPIMPYRDLEGSFTRLLQAAGLKVDRAGNRRILYSLRHSFAIWAALHRQHVPTLLVAKQMGHTLSVHAETYARVLSRDASKAFALG